MKKSPLLIATGLLCLNMAAYAQIDTAKKVETGVQFSALNNFGIFYKAGRGNTLFYLSGVSLNGNNMNTVNNFSNDGVPNSTTNSTVNSYGAGINLGFETRKPVTDKFYVYFGALLLTSYSASNSSNVTPYTSTYSYYNSNNQYITETATVNNSSTSNNSSFSIGLGGLVGLAYRLSNSFSMGVQIVPSVNYLINDTKSSNTNWNVNWTGDPTNGYTPVETMNSSANDSKGSGFNFRALNSSASISLAYIIK